MSVCIYVYMYTCIEVYGYLWIKVYMYICLCVYMYIGIYLYIYIRKATIGVIHSFRPPCQLLEKLGKGLCPYSETNFPANLSLVEDCKTNLSQKPESSEKLLVSGKR